MRVFLQTWSQRNGLVQEVVGIAGPLKKLRMRYKTQQVNDSLFVKSCKPKL